MECGIRKKYLAHISEDRTREQLLFDHLKETGKLAGKFAAEFGYQDWGECCGILHDIGKYSEKFQRRLFGDAVKTDHATAGAQVCNKKGGWYNTVGYCIAGHHSGLPDTGGTSDTENSYTARMKKKLEDYQNYQKEVAVPDLNTEFFGKNGSQNPGFQLSFFIRMLYSCLVDADFLDTEWFMKAGDIERDPGESISALWDRLQGHVAGWLSGENSSAVNKRRTEILRNCIQQGIAKKGLFSLTVPTGGGKTISSLSFALRHALEHGMKRIVYVIPYTSIIEQNAKVFRDILGERNVLEHHCGIVDDGGEELNPMQLAAENWDKPVIVTTNVQFFESLFSNKASACRKLHNLANSVIIFDEAQMLPNDYLRPCIAAMSELTEHYKSSIVLCTATQPALEKFFPKNWKAQELCPRKEDQFIFFRRASFQNLGKMSGDELAGRLQPENQALCILNSKKEVQQLYEKLHDDGVYHLSTLMYPVHRRRVLEEIRGRLLCKERCIVISTSLVEAGVDLDFNAVYRQLAGVDSVVQAAGRCNREGKRSPSESMIYLFDLEEAGKVPGQEQQIDSAKLILREYEDITSLKAVHAYFEQLYNIKGEDALDKKRIMMQCEEGGFAFNTIAREFKLIEQDTKSILIPREEEAQNILEDLRRKGATRQLMRKAGQYSVSVYQNQFDALHAAGMVLPVSEDLKESLFVLKDCRNYSEGSGLRMDVELGQDVWF